MLRAILFISAFSSLLFASPYTELVPDFNRLHSNVMIRRIDSPTLANLDFAAYDKNPVLFDRLSKIKLSKKPGDINIDTVSFGNAIIEIKDNIKETPLTAKELESPLAWKPFLKKQWSVIKEDKFQVLSSKVSSYKWADPEVFLPYQEISTVYTHTSGINTELWVKIDFSPWVNFLKNADDEDSDGFVEIYGKLNPDSLNQQSVLKIVNWINDDYRKKTLSRDEAIDWITDVASYWYPTKNTDILDLSVEKSWPFKTTKKNIKKELKDLKISNPLAVVEGKPYSPDNPVYNVFIINEVPNISDTPAPKKQINHTGSNVLDTSISENFVNNQKRFEAELQSYGSYESWASVCTTSQSVLRNILQTIPADQMGIEGKDGWLFFGKSLQYLLGGDITRQAPEKNPIPHLLRFKEYLEKQNINFIFIAVPNKEEIYFEKLLPENNIPTNQIINPFSRKFLYQAQKAGIEVIDLLPYFLKAKSEDSLYDEQVYQRQDTHWTDRGLQIASDLIADRIKHYLWYNNYNEKVNYRTIDTSFTRLGDIVDRIPESSRIKYHPVTLKATQVLTSDGALFKSLNSTAPIMLIGDSFTGVYESVDCKSAGVGANIAAKTGVPVDVITSWGGGPMVRKKAMKARSNDLEYKKVVIYMMVARDLYNYSQSWEPFPEE